MKIQRWLGLVAAAALLQSNVKLVYAACESQTAPATHHHEEHSRPDASTAAAGEEEAPVELPVTEGCCQALASCGAAVILDRSVATTVDALPPAAAIAARGKVLHGRITAPEPPPPKA